MDTKRTPAKGRKPTKQQRIDALMKALVTISAQTKGYDQYCQMGCLHEIAHKAIVAETLAAGSAQ
jgi:hypothetical protein